MGVVGRIQLHGRYGGSYMQGADSGWRMRAQAGMMKVETRTLHGA